MSSISEITKAMVTLRTQDNQAMVTLRTQDNQTFEVEEEVANRSQVIKHMVEDGFTMDVIPIPNVDGPTMSKVIEWCQKHVDTTTATVTKTNSDSSKDIEDLRTWEKKFIDVDTDTLYDLIMAANYLNMKDLLECAAQQVADLIKGKNPDEIRQTFNIENDFTPEEEDKIRKESEWAFAK